QRSPVTGPRVAYILGATNPRAQGLRHAETSTKSYIRQNAINRSGRLTTPSASATGPSAGSDHTADPLDRSPRDLRATGVRSRSKAAPDPAADRRVESGRNADPDPCREP